MDLVSQSVSLWTNYDVNLDHFGIDLLSQFMDNQW